MKGGYVTNSPCLLLSGERTIFVTSYQSFSSGVHGRKRYYIICALNIIHFHKDLHFGTFESFDQIRELVFTKHLLCAKMVYLICNMSFNTYGEFHRYYHVHFTDGNVKAWKQSNLSNII